MSDILEVLLLLKGVTNIKVDESLHVLVFLDIEEMDNKI